MPVRQRLACSHAGLMLLAIAALWPSTAAAQEVTVTLNTSDFGDTEDSTTTINLNDCREFAGGREVSVRLDFTANNSGAGLKRDYTVKLEGEGQTCDRESLAVDTSQCTELQDQENIPSSNTDTVTTTLEELFDVNSTTDCENLNLTSTLIIVSEEIDNTTNVTPQIADDLRDDVHTFRLVTTRPTITPPEVTAVGGESSIKVSFDEDSDADSFNFYYREEAFTAGAIPEDLSATSFIGVQSGNNITRGISVNRTYFIALTAVDSVGNESLLGEVSQVTTQPTFDFFENFREAGGGDPGGFGCTTTSPSRRAPGALGLLALLTIVCGTIAWRRRTRHATEASMTPFQHTLLALAALGTVAGVLMPAQQAQAQRFDRKLEGRLPTSGAIELRLGTYLPQVDDAVTGSPYLDAFGAKQMFLTELQFDRQFYNGFGTAAVGFHVGLMNVQGTSINADGTESVDKTKLNLVPLRLSLVYRFDPLAVDLDIPLVPVFKVGLDYYVWWVNSGDNIATYDDGDKVDNAIGGTLGWHASMGVYLLLDWFDEISADILLFDFGIANTYLFADFVVYNINDFGSEDSFDFSEQNAMFGIAFEY